MALILNMEMIDKESERKAEGMKIVEEFTASVAPNNKIKIEDIDVEHMQRCITIIQELQSDVASSDNMANNIDMIRPEPIPNIDFI